MKPDQIIRYRGTGAIAVNTVALLIDCGALPPDCSLSVHSPSIGAGATLVVELSNNGTDWVGGVGERINDGSVNTLNTTSILVVPIASRFVRIRFSVAATSGNTNIDVVPVSAAGRRVAHITNSPVVSLSGQPTVQGAVAHDAVVANNPVRVGARAVSANYTAVANNDVADEICTLVGVRIDKPFSIPEADWQFAGPAGGIINNTAVAARAAQAAGIRNYVTGIDVRNASGTVATEFVVLDGATVIWRGHLAINSAPIDVCFNTPLRGSAATALNVQALTTGAQVYCNLRGYSAP
ncbi:MAG: hypothetical protein DDT38_01021 [Firmicutes bacterium]|nr:hypothetical protein [candidate division NPL-UPA2 bacterium]